MHKSSAEDTIAAISTPVGEGGIGIVRLSGDRAVAISDKVFISKDGKRPSSFKTYTVHYGHIVSIPKPTAQIIDEVILTVMRAPKSYTKEDVVEINCHGGIQALRKVLELVTKCGARLAEPGEFTKRAFLNGRIDLTQAEAVLDVIRAKTEGSLKVAMDQLEGEFSKEINRIRGLALDVLAEIEASIDFPEEGLGSPEEKKIIEKTGTIRKKLLHLAETYNDGAILREGVLAIICGKPNVGKSSLMNLLLKRDRVIVSPIPGTTRDAVEEMICLKGLPIRVVDTAGITRTKDALNRQGVLRSKRYLRLADIALLVLDGSTRIEKADLDIIKLLRNKKKLVVVNKSDLAKRISAGRMKKLFKGDRIIEISVEKKRNITLLENSITEMVYSGNFVQGESAIVTSARHKRLLDKAIKNMLSVEKGLNKGLSPELIAVDLKEAVFSLGLITGKSVSEDVLDRIFEQFCIGK